MPKLKYSGLSLIFIIIFVYAAYSDTIVVNYPVYQESLPAHDTIIQEITISGTLLETHYGDTVKIYAGAGLLLVNEFNITDFGYDICPNGDVNDTLYYASLGSTSSHGDYKIQHAFDDNLGGAVGQRWGRAYNDGKPDTDVSSWIGTDSAYVQISLNADTYVSSWSYKGLSGFPTYAIQTVTWFGSHDNITFDTIQTYTLPDWTSPGPTLKFGFPRILYYRYYRMRIDSAGNDGVTVIEMELAAPVYNTTFSGTAVLIADEDTLYAVIESGDGKTDTSEIYVNFSCSPAISITYPADYIETGFQILNLSGTTLYSSFADTIDIYVNNVWQSAYSITTFHENWSGTACLAGIGDSVTVKFSNKFGIPFWDTVQIDYIETPVIRITSPVDKYDTYLVNLIDVTGTCDWCKINDTIVVYTNSTANCTIIVTSDSQDWSGTAVVNAVGDSVIVEITDRLGRKMYDSITVSQFDTPSVTITTPSFSPYPVDGNVVTIKGSLPSTSINDILKIVAANGETNTVYDTFYYGNSVDWAGTVLVSGIGETVTVLYSNKWDDLAEDTVVIDFFDTPSINITYPDTEAHDTIVMYVTISGTVNHINKGDTVRITVNGVDYPDSTITLNQKITDEWTTDIQMNDGFNTVVVILNDTFGRLVYDTVVVHYFAPPDIYITYPSSLSHDTLAKEITIAGTASKVKEGDSVGIYLYNVQAQDTVLINTVSVNDTGSWSGTVLLNRIGDTVWVYLLTSFGDTAVDSVQINYFDTPRIEINYPDTITTYLSPYDTYTKNIIIYGTVINVQINDTISISLNETYTGETSIYNIGDTELYWDSKFISLNNLINTVVVTVNDQFGRQVSDTIMVNYMPAPVIEISYPSYTLHDTGNAVISIKGTTLNTQIGDTLIVYTNYNANTTVVLTSANGSFSGTSLLASRNDSITVEINDQFGRQSFDTITVKYFSAPFVSITTLYYEDKGDSILSVQGTTLNTQTGDSVIIYTNLTVNTSVMIIEEDGSFAGTAVISDQNDSIIAVVNDRYHRKAYDTSTMAYYLGVSVEIFYPDITSHDTIYQVITVTGSTSNSQAGDTVIIYSNYAECTSFLLTASGSNFSGTALVQNRDDSIVVKIINRFGAINYDTIAVSYWDSPVAEISYPSYTVYDTDARVVTVKGSTVNTRSGDTVIIYVNYAVNTTVTLNDTDGNFSGTVLLNQQFDSVIVKIEDGFSRTTYDTIMVSYFDTPAVYISFPASDFDTDFSYINVGGTSSNTSGGDSVGLYVENVFMETAVISSDGSWSGSVNLNSLEDTIVVILFDKFQRYNYDTVVVDYYKIPEIAINFPDSGLDTYVNYTGIRGTTLNSKAGDSVGIYVNNNLMETKAVDADGIWSGSISINNIGDTVLCIFKDQFNRHKYDTILVNKRELPLIFISSSLNNLDTNINFLTVTGTSSNTSSGDSLGLYVDNVWMGTSLVAVDGTWSGTAVLNGIGDTLAVKLIDRYGFKGYDTVIINYLKTPEVYITSPDSGMDTSFNYLNITGTSGEYIIGDSVGLYVDNILMESVAVGIGGVWSGSITLNGLEDTVTAVIKNRINMLNYDTIIVNYYSTPYIDITLPADELDTNINYTVINGTGYRTRQSDSVGLYVDNIFMETAVIDSNGLWSGSVTLNGSGDSVFALLKDGFNRNAYETITINYFNTPSIDLTFPENGLDTNINYTAVKGSTANTMNADSVALYVDNVFMETVTINTEGEWSGSVTLNSVADSVFIILLDSFNRTAYDTISIDFLDSPSIYIVFPLTNTDTNTSYTLVSGTGSKISFGDSVGLYVDNILMETVSVNNSGEWSGSVTLNGLGDSITVKLKDQFSRESYDSITINYYKPAGIEFKFPVDFLDTNVNYTVCSGTSLNSSTGDSVGLYVDNIFMETVTINPDGSWSGSVSLNGLSDSVTAVLIDHFNLKIYDTITINYFMLPSLKITYPGILTHDTEIAVITVKGTTDQTSAGDTIRIFTNAVENSEIYLTGLNGDFEGTAFISGPGDSVAVYLTNTFGSTTYDTITVNYYRRPDIINSFPEDNYCTLTSVITVAGTASEVKEGDLVGIYLNGIIQDTVSTQSDSTWTGTTSLSGLGDSITVTVLNSFGRTDSFKFTVNYIEIPVIEISYPSYTSYDTKNQELTVRGTVNVTGKTDTVVIYRGRDKYSVNILAGYSENINWSGTAILSGSGDSVTACVEDEFGRKSYDTIVVNYYPHLDITLISPEDKHETNTAVIKFIWSATSVNCTYTWELSELQDFSLLTDSVSGITNEYLTRSINIEDTYYWRVRGVDNVGNYDTASAITLLLDTHTDKITLDEPDDNDRMADTMPAFSWFSLPDSSGINNYILEISRNISFTDMVFTDTFESDILTDTLNQGLTADSYYWRVRAVDILGNIGENSIVRVFEVDTYPPTVNLVSPDDRHETNAVNITFYCESDNAETFTYQVSKNAAFSSLIFNRTSNETHTVFDFTEEDTYYWLVVAGDELGRTDTSQVRTILVDTSTSKVVLSYPPEAFISSNSVPSLSWESVNDSSGIDSYIIEVYKDPEFNAVVFSDTIDGKDSSVTVSALEDSVYFWRVRAVDKLGNTGDYSDSRSFIIDIGVEITILYPSDNYDTEYNYIYISGTAASAEKGDSIGIYSNKNFQETVAVTAGLVWNGTAVISGIGDSITAYIYDRYNYIDSASITVNYKALSSSRIPGNVYGLEVEEISENKIKLKWIENYNSNLNYYAVFSDLASGIIDYDNVIDSVSAPADSIELNINTGDSEYMIVVIPVNKYNFKSQLEEAGIVVVKNGKDNGSLVRTKIDNLLNGSVVAGDTVQLHSQLTDGRLSDLKKITFYFKKLGDIIYQQAGNSLNAASIDNENDIYIDWSIANLDTGQYIIKSLAEDINGILEPFSVANVIKIIDTGNKKEMEKVDYYVYNNSNEKVLMQSLIGGIKGNNRINYYRKVKDIYGNQYSKTVKISLPGNLIDNGKKERIMISTVTAANSDFSNLTGPFDQELMGDILTVTKGDSVSVNSDLTLNDLLNKEEVELNGQVEIEVSYPDVDNDGWIDNMPGIHENKVWVWYNQMLNDSWKTLKNVEVDFDKNKIKFTVSHFTNFALSKKFSYAQTLDNVLIYPNPFIPGRKGEIIDGVNEFGEEYEQSWKGGIIFDSVPVNARIKIYTLSGEKVLDKVISATDSGWGGQGKFWRWDTNNGRGLRVASGWYLYIIEIPGDKKTGKLAIIR